MLTLLMFLIGIVSGMYFHHLLTIPKTTIVFHREYEPLKVEEQIMN